MAIGSLDSIGIAGVDAGLTAVNQAARQVAGATATGGDLARPMVGLAVGSVQAEASMTVVQSADKMLGTLVDIRV